MRGLVVWNIECLNDAISEADNNVETQKLWDALSAFWSY